jgi:hypothetical protein
VTVVLVVFAGAVVVLIALVAVGREAFTLGAQPRQAHFDLEEAVKFVADRLPDEVTARLSYDDVRSLLRWHLEYLRDRGVPVRRDQAGSGGPVVVEDDEGIAYVLGRADEDGLDATDTEVAFVLDAEVAYFEAIGAIGAPAPDLEDPQGYLGEG